MLLVKGVDEAGELEHGGIGETGGENELHWGTSR
jgi:hypothetical protein